MSKQNKVNKGSVFVKVKAPVLCHLWTKKELMPRDFHFETVLIYYKDNHQQRALIRCVECDQPYYYEFYEVVDWDKGDDKMYSTFIPIEPDESLIKDLNNKLPIELLAVTPQIHWDPDNRIYWDR